MPHAERERMVSITIAVPKNWLDMAQRLATLSNDNIGADEIAAEVRMTRADMLRLSLEYGLRHYGGGADPNVHWVDPPPHKKRTKAK